MTKPASILAIAFLLLSLSLASADVTNNVATFTAGHPSLLQILFKDYHLESDLTNEANYKVTQIPKGYVSKVTEILLSKFGATTNIDGQTFRKDVNLLGIFNEAYTNDVAISFSSGKSLEVFAAPKSIDTSGLNTNNNYLPPIIKYIWEDGQFGLLPYEGNGNGAGLAYTLSVSSPSFVNCSGLGGDNDFLRIDGGESTLGFKSSGNFGIATGNTSSNSVQDTLSAEIDYNFLFNYSIRNPEPTDARPRLAFPMGVIISPVGFEWNKEFSFGNYTPKAYIGGAILPSFLNPAYWWSKSSLGQYFDTAHNPSLPPTLFTGYTYVSPLSSITNNAAASAVRDRWDTEFIYDFPVCRWLSFRFDWDSYIGIDHSFWAHYYEVGGVLYLGNSTLQSQPNKGGHGLFFGYASGEQPPNYTKIVNSWRLGYSVQF